MASLFAEIGEQMIQRSPIYTAMEDDCWERRYYFDVATETVICVTEAVRGALQAIYDVQGEEIEQLPTPELQRAHEIEIDDERFWRMPAVDAPEKLIQCDLFAESVDSALKNLLYSALDRQDFAWFERILAMESAEYSRWQIAWDSYLEEKFQTWLTQQSANHP